MHRLLRVRVAQGAGVNQVGCHTIGHHVGYHDLSHHLGYHDLGHHMSYSTMT
jgi:hypothetical protein